MLMVCHKMRATNGEGIMDHRNEHLVSSLTDQLRSGLQKVVGALDNYSMSFAALSGMRGQSYINPPRNPCLLSFTATD